MSANQWKFVAYLKEHLPKTALDKTSVMVVLNKEWLNVLKKAPFTALSQANPSQIKDTDEKDTVSKVSSDSKEGYKFLNGTMSDLPLKIYDIKSKFSQKNGPIEEEKAKWKARKNVVSDLSIHARTKHILSSIACAESENSKRHRLELLVEHLLQYPDGICTAVKSGAISKLLKLRENNTSEDIAEVIREALTILGYTDPLPKYGIRILSIDGGGIRGLLVMDMLEKLEELTGSRVCEMFDYICGVSTGSVIACTVGSSGKSVKYVSDLYKDLSNKIFSQNAIFGAGTLIWKHGYYDVELWEKLLKEHVGMTQCIKTARRKGCPKVSVVSAVSQDQQITPFLFRNYGLPYRIKSQYPGSFKYQLWEAVRASAAAPLYFEEFQLGEHLHQDGGVIVNNPTAVAIHEAKQLWPDSPIQCIVSIGTGRTDLTISNLKSDKKSVAKQTSWKEKIKNVIVSATDTEAVHLMLNDLLPPYTYFRFNPYVSELIPMDEHEPKKLASMQKDALMYIRRNEDKFQEAANALVRERTLYQRVGDWTARKIIILSNK